MKVDGGSDLGMRFLSHGIGLLGFLMRLVEGC